MPTFTVYDQTVSGERTGKSRLEVPSERITLRELIKRRVQQEVEKSNLRRAEAFRGQAQPSGAERILNGYRLRRFREVDWKPHYEKALRGFRAKGFFVLLNGHQVEHLDEPLTLSPEAEVHFVKPSASRWLDD